MLQERIEIMYESNQVDQDTYERTPTLLRSVEQFLDITLTEDNAGSFTSHLMKAIERIKTNQAIVTCSSSLLQQASINEAIFNFSVGLLAPFNSHEIALEAEAAFIAVYLIGIKEEEND